LCIRTQIGVLLDSDFEQGTKHLIVRYQGNRTLMPRHPSQEIQTGTYYAILKKLGIKESWSTRRCSSLPKKVDLW
jgi:mRNA interferase HicA